MWCESKIRSKIPKLIYGTAWKKEHTKMFVLQAINAGFRGIDTACQPKHYHEQGVGQAIAFAIEQGITREELYIQTKFTPLGGQDPNRIPYDKNASLEDQVMQSFEVSKKNLQTEYIDALILHSPVYPYSDLIKVYRTMEKLYQAQEVCFLGISNCYDLVLLKRLYEDAIVKPAILQNRFYDMTDYDKVLRKWCDEHDVIYQSFWTLSANLHILAHEKVIEIANHYRKTPAQVLFAYLIHIGVVPLTGTTSQEHMLDDLDAQNIILTDEEMISLERLLV